LKFKTEHFPSSVTFLAFDNKEYSFALHEAAGKAGIIIGALTARAILKASPSSAPVCFYVTGILSSVY